MSTPPPPAAQVLKQALTELRELRARLASAEQRGRDPIAIVGIGCRFPGGASSPAAYWALLRDGVDATSEVPPERWDPAAYHDPDPAAPGKIYTRRGGFLDAVDGFDHAGSTTPFDRYGFIGRQVRGANFSQTEAVKAT